MTERELEQLVNILNSTMKKIESLMILKNKLSYLAQINPSEFNEGYKRGSGKYYLGEFPNGVVIEGLDYDTVLNIIQKEIENKEKIVDDCITTIEIETTKYKKTKGIS